MDTRAGARQNRHSADVIVDVDGLAYVTDCSSGLDILQYDGVRRTGDHDTPFDPTDSGTSSAPEPDVNFVPARYGPRDLTKLSPRSHADFEQFTVLLSGQFVHHIRTSWTADGTTWREDAHLPLDGPGIVIFPPPLVHTSQAVGPGPNRLCDVFSPVRLDFLSRPGWVLNAVTIPDPSPSRGRWRQRRHKRLTFAVSRKHGKGF